MSPSSRRPSLPFLLALAAAFAAGHVSAGIQFATSINKGLVNAFSSVGQNLFGEVAFESRFLRRTPSIRTAPCSSSWRRTCSSAPA